MKFIMKHGPILIAAVSVLLLANSGCDKQSSADLNCKPIVLDQPFKAGIGEKWCLDAKNWTITFGPFIEDSRCNVPEIDCVWAGRYVMGATFENGGSVRDTFFAVHNWSDTLTFSGHQVILSKVYPEIRQTMEPLDPSAYSFDIIVR
jgi:hypothetical protein